MRISILLLLACSILSSACQKEKKKAAPLACGNDLSLNKTAAVRTDVFRLRREFATVRHTDCQGRVKVSRVTVKEPKDAYSLSALTLAPNSGSYSVSAQNRSTCDSATIKDRRETDTRMEIQFHTSRGTRRTYVLKNADNYIDYEFRRCLEKNAQNQCVRSEIAERGTVILHVEYSELDRPGVTETGDTCSNPDQKKP
jgi:hypothetical protein